MPTGHPYTISIVEDERILREGMAFQLGQMGFAVQTFETAAQFYRYLAVHPKTIAVLDIGLSGEDGLSICQHLRDHDSQIGVVFVTARALRDDRLTGLAAGADAYLVKPVDVNELALLLKRLGQRYSDAGTDDGDNTTAAGAAWRVPSNAWLIFSPDGIPLELSAREHQFLRLLIEADGRIVPKRILVEKIFGMHLRVGEERLEVMISRLRKKGSAALGQTLPIKTANAQGYAFGAPATLG